MKGLAYRKRSMKYRVTDSEYRLIDLDKNYPIFDMIDSYSCADSLMWRSCDIFNPSKRLYNKSFNDIESLRYKAGVTFNGG